jgi:hypothetical protein
MAKVWVILGKVSFHRMSWVAPESENEGGLQKFDWEIVASRSSLGESYLKKLLLALLLFSCSIFYLCFAFLILFYLPKK